MDKIIIPEDVYHTVIDHVIKNFPEEACGVLAGTNNTVTIGLPVTNQLHSRVKFYMEPIELYKALERIESEELDLLAIFHSHPKGPDRPSETDVKEFLYPGVATIICSPKEDYWLFKPYMIENGNYHEIELVLNWTP